MVSDWDPAAPVIGGFVVERKGWRWLEWVSVFISAATCLATLGMRETYKKVLLQRRAKKRGQDAAKSQHRVHPIAAIRAWTREAMLRPLVMLVSEPIVLFFSLYIGFDFAVLYAFFASLQLVFRETYGFDSHETGLVFLSLAVGASLATVTSLLIDRLIYQRKRRQLERQGLKKVPPEYRLYPAMIGSVGVAGGLFWFAWTARPDVHWASAVVALVPFNWGNLCIFVRNLSLSSFTTSILTQIHSHQQSYTSSTATDPNTAPQHSPPTLLRDTSSQRHFLCSRFKVRIQQQTSLRSSCGI